MVVVLPVAVLPAVLLVARTALLVAVLLAVRLVGHVGLEGSLVLLWLRRLLGWHRCPATRAPARHTRLPLLPPLLPVVSRVLTRHSCDTLLPARLLLLMALLALMARRLCTTPATLCSTPPTASHLPPAPGRPHPSATATPLSHALPLLLLAPAPAARPIVLPASRTAPILPNCTTVLLVGGRGARVARVGNSSRSTRGNHTRRLIGLGAVWVRDVGVGQALHPALVLHKGRLPT